MMNPGLKIGILGLTVFLCGAAGFAQSGGEATYKAKCQMCHGATGAGDTPAGKAMKVKSFEDPEVAKMSAAALEGITKNGSGKMPAYKDKLTDAQIKDVITYIQGLEKK
ncbi:MAG TPA: cytochrome c [Terracidiphilus sp.]|jgi:cytochrome c6|nr:cytochrome c [Terracidiphilus sp.]